MAGETGDNWPQEATEERRALVMLVHDMRNALNGLLGNVAMIDVASMRDADRGRLEAVALSAQLLSGLVEAAGNLARTAGTSPSPVAVATDDLLAGLERAWKTAAGQRGLEFTVERGAGVAASIVVDRLRLDRILGNLVGNAVKFTERGGVTVALRAAPQDWLAIEIADTGPGLDLEVLRRLYEPYARGEGAPGRGEGLGLHIAKTETEVLGGTLDVANRPEGGCMARLLLPLRPERADVGPGPADLELAEPLPPARPPVDASARPLADLSVLLAEDNVTNQLVASQMLGTLGAEVTIASDGAEAIDHFQGRRFDLALIDIEMPRVSGLDVIRTVRALPDARAGTTLIALTAYAMREHRERIARAGADGLIAKPILGIREFGAEILAIHRRRTPEVVAGGEDDATVDPGIYRGLADTIGPEAMAELLEKVESDLADVAEGLVRGLATADLPLVRARSHVLISVAGAIGATRLQRLAETLNRAAHDSEGGDITALSRRIGAGISLLRDHVRRERETALRHG